MIVSYFYDTIYYIYFQMNNKALNSLLDIGLNQLQAEVYLLLLKDQSMTAYKVGKILKKPSANIYKALEVLSDIGAVIILEGKNKLWKAVNPDEFIAARQGAFEEKSKQAAKELASIETTEEDESTYSISSVSLSIEKARTMIDAAKVVVVVDAFPLVLDLLTSNLKKAAKRGVEINIQAYSAVDIPGAEVYYTEGSDEVISYWKSQQLNIVADGEQSLVALFDEELSTVFHATWSTNIYLSCIVHAGRTCEQTIQRLMTVGDTKDKLKKMEDILSEQKFFRNSNVPGVKKLFDRHLTKK